MELDGGGDRVNNSQTEYWSIEVLKLVEEFVYITKKSSLKKITTSNWRQNLKNQLDKQVLTVIIISYVARNLSTHWIILLVKQYLY